MVGAMAAQQKAGPAEPAPVTVQLVISLSRQTIREKDRIPVSVSLSNASSKGLTNVTLRWSIPSDFLALYPGACRKQDYADNAPSSFSWPAIPANEDAQSTQTKDFCLVSSTANEDTFNLGFALEYEWTENGHARHSMVTVQKPIKSAFLGTDTLAGIPLGLASYIVPGLLFWMVLDWWSTPWRVQGDVLADKMIYSVLLSLLLIAIVSPVHWLQPYTDVTSGLSMTKLEFLALFGAVAGLATGGGDRAVRWYLTRRSLRPTDQELVLLEKLLRLNPGRLKPSSIVRMSNGVQYRGSVGAQTATHTFLMGWYQISRVPGQPDISPAVRNEIAGMIGRGEYYNALRTARTTTGLQVNPRDYIYRRTAGGPETQEDAIMRLVKVAEEIDGPINITETSGDGAHGPLEMS
jgi:hypothetical protein